MTFSDYLLDSILVLVVLRQLRESRLTLHAILIPLGIITWAATTYLSAIPTGGNDLALVVGTAGIGVILGALGARFTNVRADGGKWALVKASWLSAAFWVASMGFRFGFAVWASNGGGPSLARFSAAHHLSISVWTDALILMALGEVVTRVGILVFRGRRAVAQYVPTPLAAPIASATA